MLHFDTSRKQRLSGVSAWALASLLLVGGVLRAQSQEAAPPNEEAGPGVARISLLNGDVSVRRGDSSDAFAAALNAPLEAADVIATGPSARAEVQFDAANRLRIGHDTEARIAEMQQGHYRVELARGTVSVSVSRGPQAQLEVSTPNVSVRSPGEGLVRVWVRDDNQTVVTVRRGQAEIFTERGTERMSQGQTMFVRGTAQDPEYQVVQNTETDEWDTWNEQRDRALENVSSYQYVNPAVTGAEDLDANGTWNEDPAYGEVWTPRVAPGWAPYQQGRWVWEDYYGWTWVSTDPWGWAPYHYGSWYYGSAGWCWYPGSIGGPVFWRPALVAFFGFGIGGGYGGWGRVGWVPLGPYEHFYPWYGRGGYRNVNVVNVNILNTYRNARTQGAASAVSVSALNSGHFGAISRVTPGELRQAGLARGGLPVTPNANNLRFSERQTAVVPRQMNSGRYYSPSGSQAVTRTSFERQQSSGFRTGSSLNQSPGTSTTSAWSRFGSPSRAGGAPVNGPRTADAAGWSRFGAPNVNRPSVAEPRNGFASSERTWETGPRGSGQGSSPSLRIAPPIVHNRAYDTPSRSYAPSAPTQSYRQQGYGTPQGGGGAPRSYSPPPQSSRGGGGGSAPHYSAPASGGGGSASHSSGGGGGHHR